jgi:hypothetical protein
MNGELEFAVPLETLGNPPSLTLRFIAGDSRQWDADTTDTVKIRTPFFQEPVFIDGDLSDFPNGAGTVSAEDPRDCSGANAFDIKKVRAAILDGFLYVGAEYFSTADRSLTDTHTLHIKDLSTGRHYWVQGPSDGFWGMHAFDDGTPYEKWDTVPIPAGSEAFIAKQGEWKIPLSLFPGKPGRLSLTYLASGLDASGKPKWDMDSSPELTIGNAADDPAALP